MRNLKYFIIGFTFMAGLGTLTNVAFAGAEKIPGVVECALSPDGWMLCVNPLDKEFTSYCMEVGLKGIEGGRGFRCTTDKQLFLEGIAYQKKAEKSSTTNSLGKGEIRF